MGLREGGLQPRPGGAPEAGSVPGPGEGRLRGRHRAATSVAGSPGPVVPGALDLHSLPISDPVRLSDTEWTVMAAVWGGGSQPSTARDVHARVADSTGWSYSTVRTLLARLVEKGALADARRGNALEYRACVTAEEARRSALRSLVDRAFGGRVTALVQHLAEDEALCGEERAELERMLAEDGADREGER